MVNNFSFDKRNKINTYEKHARRLFRTIVNRPFIKTMRYVMGM